MALDRQNPVHVIDARTAAGGDPLAVQPVAQTIGARARALAGLPAADGDEGVNSYTLFTTISAPNA